MAVEHLGAEYFQDPYSVHARLRAQRPVSPVIMPGGTPAWLVTGYAEARAALTDPRLRKNMPGWHPPPDSIFAALDVHMLNSDPPDHERLRRLVNKAFTARRVERLRPRITAITTGLLDDMSSRKQVDLLASFAFPLPITVICELLGVPVADQDDFRTWSATIVSDTAIPGVFQAHATAMIRYFMALLAVKRQESADDLLSALISARDNEDRLSENELVSMAFLLLVAGHETTVNLIGNGVLALLLNPAELARLRAEPSLVGGAVEELLRHVNPVNNATFRFAAEPVEIGGVRVSRGDPVLVALSSANRIRLASVTRTGWTWAGTARGTWRSATASTTAWARRWPGWRQRSPSLTCWRGSARCGWRCPPSRCAGGPGRSSTAWSRCRCGSLPEPPGGAWPRSFLPVNHPSWAMARPRLAGKPRSR